MSVDTIQAATSLDPAQAQVAGAIKRASDATGAGFGYMVASAKIESNLKSNAAASTSSAKGLYQFIEQTWLGTMKGAGAQLGYGRYANAIQRTASGSYTVSDPATRAAILNLRSDPTANAAMGGVLTRSNTLRLVGSLGRKPTDPELYMAHFLGAGGASRLISKAEDNPSVSAVAMFPRAAAANRSVFYERSGQPRNVSQVYAELSRRYNAAASSPVARTMIASAAPTQNVAVASTAAPAPRAAYAPVPAPAAVDSALQAQTSVTVNLPSIEPEPAPRFRSLFQGSERPEAISPTVRELWGRSDVATATTQADAPLAVQPKLKAPTPLDLFSDRYGTFAS